MFSPVLGNLITVIFYYQISLKPLKTLDLSQVSFSLLFPLCYNVPSVFTNSDKGKYKGNNKGKLTCDKLSVFKGLRDICRIQSTQKQHWCIYQCWQYAPHWLLGSWKEFKNYTRIRLCIKRTCYCAVDCILQILFSSYLISPYHSINYQLQKSEAFQSVHHVTFILCYTVL